MKIESLINPEWIVTVDKQHTILQKHSIAVAAGKIQAILPTDEALQYYQPEQQYDLPQQAVMPGLINAHTHAAMSLLKGFADDRSLMDWLQNYIWPAENDFMSEAFVHDGTQLALVEMIRSGTTCFNDMYFFPESALQAIRTSGMRATLGMILIEFPSAYAQNATEYLQKGRALNQLCQPEPLIQTLLAPHAPYTVSDDSLLQMGQLVADFNISMHMHVHETAHEVQDAFAQHQERPLTRLQRLGLLNEHFIAVHMTQLTTEEIEMVAQQGVHVVHCPESNMKLASGFCPVDQLQKAGVNVALGTDGNASNNDLDMWGEMRSAALLGKVVADDASAVDARQILRMATINGAKALGIDAVTGSLEVGKSADMISIDLSEPESQPLYDPVSHLVYCTARNQVSHNWVAGRLLMEKRQLTTLNQTDILRKVHDWQQKLEARHGEC